MAHGKTRPDLRIEVLARERADAQQRLIQTFDVILRAAGRKPSSETEEKEIPHEDSP